MKGIILKIAFGLLFGCGLCVFLILIGTNTISSIFFSVGSTLLWWDSKIIFNKIRYEREPIFAPEIFRKKKNTQTGEVYADIDNIRIFTFFGGYICWVVAFIYLFCITGI